MPSNEFHTLVTGNRIFQKRTQGVGYISAEDAIDWGLSGPILRGSGVELDVRRANPYTSYETYDLKFPSSTMATFGRAISFACAKCASHTRSCSRQCRV
jgi:NADH-quinone oxidoreductase subunit D